MSALGRIARGTLASAMIFLAALLVKPGDAMADGVTVLKPKEAQKLLATKGIKPITKPEDRTPEGRVNKAQQDAQRNIEASVRKDAEALKNFVREFAQKKKKALAELRGNPNEISATTVRLAAEAVRLNKVFSHILNDGLRDEFAKNGVSLKYLVTEMGPIADGSKELILAAGGRITPSGGKAFNGFFLEDQLANGSSLDGLRGLFNDAENAKAFGENPEGYNLKGHASQTLREVQVKQGEGGKAEVHVKKGGTTAVYKSQWTPKEHQEAPSSWTPKNVRGPYSVWTPSGPKI